MKREEEWKGWGQTNKCMWEDRRFTPIWRWGVINNFEAWRGLLPEHKEVVCCLLRTRIATNFAIRQVRFLEHLSSMCGKGQILADFEIKLVYYQKIHSLIWLSDQDHSFCSYARKNCWYLKGMVLTCIQHTHMKRPLDNNGFSWLGFFIRSSELVYFINATEPQWHMHL